MARLILCLSVAKEMRIDEELSVSLSVLSEKSSSSQAVASQRTINSSKHGLLRIFLNYRQTEKKQFRRARSAEDPWRLNRKK